GANPDVLHRKDSAGCDSLPLLDDVANLQHGNLQRHGSSPKRHQRDHDDSARQKRRFPGRDLAADNYLRLAWPPEYDYHLTVSNSQGTRNVDLSGGGDIRVNSSANYSYAPTIQANLPTNLSDGAADSYVTSYANNNSNTPPANPKNHKKPKK